MTEANRIVVAENDLLSSGEIPGIEHDGAHHHQVRGDQVTGEEEASPEAVAAVLEASPEAAVASVAAVRAEAGEWFDW